MECMGDDPGYQTMQETIKAALDEYAIGHPEQHVAVKLILTQPGEHTTVMTTNIVAGNMELTRPRPIDVDSYPVDNDGRDPCFDLCGEIMSLAGVGHREFALDLAQRIVDRFPSSSVAYQYLAYALLASGRRDESVEVIRKSADLLDDPWVHSRPEYEVERRLELANFTTVFHDAQFGIDQAQRAVDVAKAAGLADLAERGQVLLRHLTP